MKLVVPSDSQHAEENHAERGDEPVVGRWYYVRDKESGERSLGCVTHLGSNYVKLTFPGKNDPSVRVHNDHFWDRCEHVADSDSLLRGNAERCRRELNGLMEDVKALTAKLGVAPSVALGAGEALVLAITLAPSTPADGYKTALVKAKDETLPELFERIQDKSEEYARWLSAQAIPLRAEADKLGPTVKRVEDRIFAVELYAGLCEHVELVKDGEPAALTEPVHLFQRRLYMDEECLANYDAGGMEFKNLRQFDRWLCRRDNLDRVLPFPRTVVAFRVRRHDKKREVASIREFVRMFLDDVKRLDKLTFLYIRNGGRVYRLSTEIDFGETLFPDVDHPVLSAGEGKLYAYLSKSKIISEREYRAMVESEAREDAEYERHAAEEAKKPKKDRQYVFRPSHYFDGACNYEPFTRDNVHYDDILRRLRAEMEQHNRVVLVLQGLLDRSPALHPHPPWRLFENDGFAQALRLHRDSDRVLVAGDKPDFEAYRSKLNASIDVGTVTIGQQLAWLRFEARKENARRDNSSRWARVDYRPQTFQPDGDPGPGRFARVARVDRQGQVHYRWTKDRRKEGPPVARRYGCKTARVFNVDAYQPDDYKLFFADPRTREEYLQWAPFLLAAEEYKAGTHGEVPPLAEAPKPVTRPKRWGKSEYMRRKEMRALLGKAVKLSREITTRGGTKYKKGSLWRVTWLTRDGFTVDGVDEQGEIERESNDTPKRAIRCLSVHDFVVESSLPSDPQYEYKKLKRAHVTDLDDEDSE